MSNYIFTNHGNGRVSVTEDSPFKYCCLLPVWDAFIAAYYVISKFFSESKLDNVQKFLIGFFIFVIVLILFRIPILSIILNVVSTIVWTYMGYLILFDSIFDHWNLLWKIGGTVIIFLFSAFLHYAFYCVDDV